MTVTNPTVIYSYPVGGGGIANFPYPQAFIAPTDLRVLLLDAAGASIAPPPALNGGAPQDYHVTGTPDAATGAYPSGGGIVFNNAPNAPAVTVQIARVLPIVQPVALIDDAAFPAATINLELDRLTMICQQLNAGILTQAGPAPPLAAPGYAGLVPVVTSDGTAYEMRQALLISPTDATTFDAMNHRIESVLAPTAAGDAAPKSYVDAGDAATLTAAETYASNHDATTLASAKSYADAGDAATLTSAHGYADAGDAATLTSAHGYADAGDATTLAGAKTYTDAQIAGTGQVPPPLAGDVGKKLTATGAGAYAWQPPAVPIIATIPTRRVLTATGTGNYTPPAGVKWIEVLCVGGGGGGAGSGGGATVGGNGAATTFGNLSAGGGTGAGIGAAGAIPGGIASNGDWNMVGGQGNTAPGNTTVTSTYLAGGAGGCSIFAGNGGASWNSPGGDAGFGGYHTGSGGGGGGGTIASVFALGSGGGAGGACGAILAPGPWSYIVGTGGAAGAAGSGGFAGGAGAPGIIIITEHYNY